MKKCINKRRIFWVSLLMIKTSVCGLTGCGKKSQNDTRIITDCSGAQVEIPKDFF